MFNLYLYFITIFNLCLCLFYQVQFIFIMYNNMNIKYLSTKSHFYIVQIEIAIANLHVIYHLVM